MSLVHIAIVAKYGIFSLEGRKDKGECHRFFEGVVTQISMDQGQSLETDTAENQPGSQTQMTGEHGTLACSYSCYSVAASIGRENLDLV